MNSAVVDLSFSLLRLGLGIETADQGDGECWLAHLRNDVSNQEWDEIYQLGVAQGVAAIQFVGLQSLYKKNGVPPSSSLPTPKMKMQWFAHTMLVENRCSSQLKTASELANRYAGNGIRTVVLKGIVAGANYPQPNLRPCGDLDCFLMGDYEKGNAVAEKVGANVKRDFYKHSHISYKGLRIENHQFCTGIRGSRKAKAFERLLQSILEQEGTTPIGDTKLECPSVMFNALFLTNHAQRHFLSEGITVRHLCDWAMLVHKQGDKIDWVKFKEYCEEFGMGKFAESMTRLSEKLLNVKIPASYAIGNDEERDNYLFDMIMNGITHISPSDSIWRHRLDIVKNVLSSRKRYKMFSESSYLQNICQLVYGYCFDSNPHL